MITVYLSGGMHSEWREFVKDSVPRLAYIDPCEHSLDKPGEYTAWDLFGVRQCDILLAYMEKDNPSGIGLALELGMAKALGKLTILIDDRDDRYTAILQYAAELTFDYLADAIGFLARLPK